MRITSWARGAVALCAVVLMAGCASSGAAPRGQDEDRPQPRAQSRGPKKTVAVARFDANGAFVARYGGYDIGGGLAAQLASELQRSGRFAVVERAELSGMLREQEMALMGLTTAHTSPQAGKLMGAQLLVRGSVTEFSEGDSGSGFRVGGPVVNGFGGAVSTRSRTGHVTIDLRVIDTTSGRVVATHTVDQEIKQRSLGLEGVSESGATFGYDAFERSPLGKATREAIAQAVVFMSSEMADVPWNAQVAKVKGGQVYVNAGADASLYEGSTLGVYRVVDQVRDPHTGEVLGVEERRIGTVTLSHIDQRYSRGTFSGGQRPRVGDLLRSGA